MNEYICRIAILSGMQEYNRKLQINHNLLYRVISVGDNIFYWRSTCNTTDIVNAIGTGWLGEFVITDDFPNECLLPF